MKKWSLIFMVALIGLAINCSSITTQFDYERGEDFSRFKTFSFLPVPPELARNQLLVNRIGDAIVKQLATKGMSESDSNPDLLIAVHTQVKDKVNVTSYGYGYAPAYSFGYWGGIGMGGTDVRQYEEGTLIIDMVDAQQKEMVWRGMASKALPSAPTPEKVDKIIDDIVAKIFEKYPPPTR
jgi:hypothetical protein